MFGQFLTQYTNQAYIWCDNKSIHCKCSYRCSWNCWSFRNIQVCCCSRCRRRNRSLKKRRAKSLVEDGVVVKWSKISLKRTVIGGVVVVGVRQQQSITSQAAAVIQTLSSLLNLSPLLQHLTVQIPWSHSKYLRHWSGTGFFNETQ